MNKSQEIPEAPGRKLELEEADARALRRIGKGIDTLELRNRTGKDVDELTLAGELGRVAGIERIRSLVIDWSSRVKDLRFLEALPALETLELYGYHLRSLEGLEWFRHGRYINIETEKNRSRNIERIADAGITRLSLQWANQGDLDAIARSSTIRELLLSKCPGLSLARWRGVPIKYLGLWDGTIDELADTKHIKSLRELTLYGCRKLRRFKGNNSNVRWLVVQACNSLDFRSIATLRGLESLAVVGTNKEMRLSDAAQLDRLRSLSFQKCNVRADVVDLKTSARRLEKLTITGLKKDQAAGLSRVNRGVLISNGSWTYKDGTRVPEA